MSIAKDFWEAMTGKEKSWEEPLTTFAGMPIIKESTLCVWKVTQRKTHRKARINKKWAKQFGFDRDCVAKDAYSVMGKMMMCPHMIDAIQKGVAARVTIETTIKPTNPRPGFVLESDR